LFLNKFYDTIIIEKVFYKQGVFVKNTIEDVAKLAGVSITTVSRVINKNYPVKAVTRAKVEEAVRELSFVPNSMARGLIKKKTFTIGVVVPSMTNLFFPEVVRGIEKILRPMGYILFLAETMEEDEKETQIINMMKERLVDGIIIIGASYRNIKNGFFEEINKEMPLVIINSYNKGIRCNYILTDEETGSQEALEYLYSMGHRNIGFVGGRNSYSYDMKEETYKRFLIKHKLELNKDNILKIKTGNNPESVEAAMNIAIDRFRKNNPPTALFCCNDWIAAGVTKGMDKLGLSVPSDISITGFDNILISQINTPKLTTVNQKMDNIGINSARLLMDIINTDKNKREIKKILLETSLVIRQSCTNIKTGEIKK
jgi:LacI family transcriptional regulator